MLKVERILGIIVLLLALAFRADAQEAKRMPVFEKIFHYDTEKVFDVDSLSQSEYILMVFYDAGCGHCQELGEDLEKSWDKWGDKCEIFFVSMNEKEDVDRYRATYVPELAKKQRVSFLKDPVGEFILALDPQQFPSLYIFRASDRAYLTMLDGKHIVKQMLGHIR